MGYIEEEPMNPVAGFMVRIAGEIQEAQKNYCLEQVVSKLRGADFDAENSEPLRTLIRKKEDLKMYARILSRDIENLQLQEAWTNRNMEYY